MISATSTWSRRPCNPSTTRSAHGWHPCLGYVVLPMCPGRTWGKMVAGERYIAIPTTAEAYFLIGEQPNSLGNDFLVRQGPPFVRDPYTPKLSRRISSNPRPATSDSCDWLNRKS